MRSADALFHRVCLGVASVPEGEDRARWALCRTFDHTPVEAVAKCVKGQNRPPKSVAGLLDLAVASPHIALLAETLIRLKHRRHDADYNFMVAFGRSNALQAVRESRAAIDALDAVHGKPSWRAFASPLLLKSSPVDR